MDPERERTSTRAELSAAAGQNCWPPAGSYMTATGQDLMAADTGPSWRGSRRFLPCSTSCDERQASGLSRGEFVDLREGVEDVAGGREKRLTVAASLLRSLRRGPVQQRTALHRREHEAPRSYVVDEQLDVLAEPMGDLLRNDHGAVFALGLRWPQPRP